MLSVTRHGITSRFDTSPWDAEGITPTLYRPFLNGVFYEQAFLDHIRAQQLKGVYVDAGACLATHTVWFAMFCPSTHVHSFEPRKKFAGWVRMQVAVNELDAKVTVHEVGLGAEPGRVSVNLDRVDENFAVMRLDQAIPRRGGRVAVLKIDVEGMEVQVLRGAHRILSKDRPAVYAEAWDEAARDEIEAFLAPYGYRATGLVFNASPTYEFVNDEPWVSPVRRAARRLPKPVRQVIIAVRDLGRS